MGLCSLMQSRHVIPIGVRLAWCMLALNMPLQIVASHVAVRAARIRTAVGLADATCAWAANSLNGRVVVPVSLNHVQQAVCLA